MIVYFADRKMNILGKASTYLPNGYSIINDKKIEDVDSGIATIEITVAFTKGQQTELQSMMDAGNYILRYDDMANEFYTIIETRVDAKMGEITVYAEDAGMDLLNEINGPYEATEAHDIEWYINYFAVDTGFEININEIPTLSRKLKWEGEATTASRIRSVATEFGAELSYSFEVEGLKVTHKYINIHIERGQDTDITLHLNREIDNITTTKTIANLCTALEVQGGIPEGKTDPITLSGYRYDDGDFYVSGTRLLSRNALAKWSRYVWKDEPNKVEGYSGHIVGSFSYETTSQEELCNRAIVALKKKSDMEVNYEVEIGIEPEARIGDRVFIVDDNGELYLQSRILRLERSVTQGTFVATLGDFLIKDSGISDQILSLAEQLKEISEKKQGEVPTKLSQLENDTNFQTDSQVSSTVNTAKVEAISTASSDATNKANSAKAEAISTAASDATSKANAALNDSKTYTDGKYSSLRAEMIQADFLDAKAAKITDLVTENLEVGSINGNVIKDGSVVAKALSNEAVTTLSGIKLYYSADEPTVTAQADGSYTDEAGHVMRDGDTWYQTVIARDSTILNPLNEINDTVKDTYSDGVITRRVGVVDLGTLNWTYSSTYKRFDGGQLADAKPVTDNTRKFIAICDKYDIRGSASSIQGTGIGLTSTKNLLVYDNSYTNATTFKNAMQGVMLYYELAEPYEEQGELANSIMSVWTNGAWLETPLDGSIIRANSITAQEIAANTITGNNIAGNSLSIGNMDETVMSSKGERGQMQWSDNALHITSSNADKTEKYETEIGGDGIKFKYQDQTVASIDQDQLIIDKTLVFTEMKIGNWSWAVNPINGNLMVKWGGN